MKNQMKSTEKNDHKQFDAVIIGASILDIPVGPVDDSVFLSGSHPVESIRIYTGGDALNESIILSRLGKKVHLISRIGEDEGGRFILDQCRINGVDTSGIRQIAGLDTGINLVLIGGDGERSFVTASSGSLRKQDPSDVCIKRLPPAKILMLASIFVYPLFTVKEMERIFREAGESGYLVCADMTKCKHGERIEDIAPALRYVDFIFPNWEEAAMVSGLQEPDEIAEAFLNAGVGVVVLKMGKKGSLIRVNSNQAALKSCESLIGCRGKRFEIPAAAHVRPVDTTGAGDTFAAAFLCALSEGKPLEECGIFASAAAGITIEAFGATTALQSREQVQLRLRKQAGPLTEVPDRHRNHIPSL